MPTKIDKKYITELFEMPIKYIWLCSKYCRDLSIHDKNKLSIDWLVSIM